MLEQNTDNKENNNIIKNEYLNDNDNNDIT